MRVVVVGAGVAGLTAARDLVVAGHDVVVLDAADRPGGKLRRSEVGGVVVDVGAEAMLARRPEGVALAAALGLDVVHPTTASARVWTHDALRPLPRTLLGAPLGAPHDLADLAAGGILSDPGLARAREQEPVPVPADDVSVGSLVAARYGPEVVDRLVEPLLGGVYAGHAHRLSVRAAAPQLPTLLARDVVDVPVTTGPVFAGLPGGMAGLADALADGVEVRTATTVRALRRTPDGFVLTTGATTATFAGREEPADAVVLATPAAPTARLLGDLAPTAAARLAEVEYASVVVVTLAFRAVDVPPGLDAASGFLVPPVDGRRVKAATFSFAKWDWVRAAGARVEGGGGLVHLRTSLGRHGEERALQATDDDLVAWSRVDLAAAAGLTAAPVATHVQRWGGGLPQYAVGHLDRVASIRADVARVPGLAVCGAAYDGVGIAACIASGHRAAAEIVPGMMTP